jgi:putative DNA primase/helicase
MPRKLIYIAEGFATGAAIHEATGEAAAIAFNAGNLKTVAKALRKKYPNVELVIAADNDQWTEGNPGLTKAVETAQAVKARVAVPSFTETLTRPTDFCDLFSLRGAEEVKKQLARACAPELLIGVPGVLASQVKPEKVDWLWKNHIPLGAMTLLDGDPGRGKSCITLDLAARVTKGWGMPDGSDAQLPTRGVVVISLEDSISRAILPRLIAAGADLERVRIIEGITGSDGTERLVTVTEDLLPIHKAIHAMDAALVIVDPVMATFDQQTNTWKDQEVRRALVPLIKLCERQNITLLVLRHFNKTQGGNPLYRGGGSIAFIGAARAAFMVGKDPDDETGYVLAMTKSNYGPEVPSLRYRIKGYPEPPHIEWEGESPHHAVNLLDDSEGDEDRGAAKEAEDFIRAMLAVGRVPARDIFTEGKKLGHSERTLKRVKRKLGVRSTLEGQGKEGTWYWEPPERVKDHQEGANGWGLAPSRHPTDINGVNSTISAESANSQTLAPSRIQKPS